MRPSIKNRLELENVKKNSIIVTNTDMMHNSFVRSVDVLSHSGGGSAWHTVLGGFTFNA